MNIADFLFQKEKKPKVPHKKEIDGVLFNYVKCKKSKSVKIAIKDRFNVKVTLPEKCPYKIAEHFVQLKMNWIKDKINIFNNELFNEDFQTKTGNLIIASALIHKTVIKKTGNIIQFLYPIGADFYSKEIQTALRCAVKKALYIEAKEYLPCRLNELAQKFGFKFNKIALKTHKTRWGSCSFNNNINLNINLMNLSSKLIDYVLIHELCHTIEKNHQKSFWTLVSNCMPDAKEIRKELKTKKPLV